MGYDFFTGDGKQSFPVGLFLKEDSHRIGFSRLGGVFTHLLKTHAAGIEDFEEKWAESDLEVEESSVPLLITIDMFTYAAYLYCWVIVFMNLICTHAFLL